MFSQPVLVTGATGFTGSNLAIALSERGYAVRALARASSDVRRLQEHGIEIVEGDIRDAAAVNRAVAGVHTVYHIAAVFRTAGHPDSYYREVNVDGTRNVLDAVGRHGVERVVHCSTVGVHGAVVEIPSNEQSPYNPGDIYQETKLEGELEAQRAFADGIPGVIVRPAGIYGPGDLRFLKLFRTVHNGTFRMFGSGEVPYHLTYIDDLVDGIVLCGTDPRALGEIYIIGGKEYVSLNELVRLVATAVGAEAPERQLPLWPLIAAATACEWICRPLGIDPPLHRRRVEFFVKPRAFSIEKAERELGYEPRVPLIEGLHRTASWYFDEGYLTGPRPRARALRFA